MEMEPGIKGVSDIRRMPRRGKIRLGIKVGEPEKNPYPKAVDYFVVPDEIKQHVGDKPKKLNIMFPVEDHHEFAIQWLKCYSFTQGLVCKGNGTMCRRKVDTATGAMADHTTQEWVWKDGLLCDPDECPAYAEKQCRRVMNLLFLMQDVPGFGAWQLDTTSFYSIININSSIDLIKRLCGRISFIPLTLSLEPQLVEPPGIKRKKIYTLQIRSDVKLADIQRLGRRKPELVLLPPLDEEEAPTDLYPEEVLAGAEGGKPAIRAEDKSGGAAAEEQPVDEGFHIDLDWLTKALQLIKWSDDTAKSWLLTHFGIDTKGDLKNDVLPQCTKEQAEKFVAEVQNRAAKVEMELGE